MANKLINNGYTYTYSDLTILLPNYCFEEDDDQRGLIGDKPSFFHKMFDTCPNDKQSLELLLKLILNEGRCNTDSVLVKYLDQMDNIYTIDSLEKCCKSYKKISAYKIISKGITPNQTCFNHICSFNGSQWLSKYPQLKLSKDNVVHLLESCKDQSELLIHYFTENQPTTQDLEQLCYAGTTHTDALNYLYDNGVKVTITCLVNTIKAGYDSPFHWVIYRINKKTITIG